MYAHCIPPPVTSTPIVQSTCIDHPSTTPVPVPQGRVESMQPVHGKTKHTCMQKASDAQDTEDPPMLNKKVDDTQDTKRPPMLKKKPAGGCPTGTQNWTDDDLTALVCIVKAIIPIGMKGWK